MYIYIYKYYKKLSFLYYILYIYTWKKFTLKIKKKKFFLNKNIIWIYKKKDANCRP